MKLAKYIGQLIQDLQRVQPPAVVRPSLEMESADEHERLLFRPNLEGPEDATWQELGVWLDLERIQFPPVEQLEKPLLARLIDAMVGAISRLNISFVFPHDLPLARRYTLMLAYWDEDVPFSPTSQWTIDFCAGWYEECALGDYCTCEKEFGPEGDFPISVCITEFPEPVFWGRRQNKEADADCDDDLLSAEEETELRYLDQLRSEFEDEFGEEE